MFPEDFATGSVNYFAEIKRKALLQIKLIKFGYDKNVDQLINDINQYHADMIAPRNLNENNSDNYIKALDLSFENICTSMEEMGVHNPRELTVFQFNSKISYFKKKRNKTHGGDDNHD